LILFASCGTVKNIHKNTDIFGTWCLVATNEINYPTITFKENSFATLGSKMDTVYGHKYYLKGDKLYFVLADAKVSRNKIIKLTGDSLILETLLSNNQKQSYYRCNKK
jgi:hypothetical protein